MRTLRKQNHALALLALAGLSLTPLPVWARQEAAPPAGTPQTPPVTPPGTNPVPALPGPKTPPTPLPEQFPRQQVESIVSQKADPVRVFGPDTPPGQPLPGDPTTIRTLDEALAIALQRNPQIQLATENIIKVQKTIDQILGGRGPQISANITYSRLANSSSAFGGGSGGVSPTQIQNPFSGGLQGQAPGTIPITLSGGSAAGIGSAGTISTGGAVGVATSGAGAAAASGGQSAISRAVGIPSQVTRQQNGDDDGDGDGDGNGGGGGGVFGNSFNPNQANARLTVTQLIDITGIIRVAEQVGDLQLALSQLELARAQQQLAFDVRNAYYNVLRAQAFVRVNEAAVAQSQELVRVTEAQKNAGVASDFDVLRARTQLENNRQALISSRNQVLVTRNAFANTLGIDPATVIDLQDVTQVPPTPTLDEEALLATALQRRPEAIQADVNILKSRKNTRLARRGLEPFLNVGVTAGYAITEPALGRDSATGALTVGLTLPIWDGGATRAAVESARSDERTALITKDQYIRGIKAEVQQTAISVRDAAERREAAEATVLQAREALRLANVRFRAGVGTQLEINDAQTALIQAEVNQVNAQYDYLAALARLARVTGDTSVIATTANTPAPASAPAASAPDGGA